MQKKVTRSFIPNLHNNSIEKIIDSENFDFDQSLQETGNSDFLMVLQIVQILCSL